MAILKTKRNDAIMFDCNCGCGDGVHFKINKEDDLYCFVTYFNSNFYRDQYGAINTLKKKIIKIWKVITNIDIYYSDIIMTQEQYQDFKEFINQH